MPFIRYKKIGQKEYAYQITAYWDPKTKKPKQKTQYLGQIINKEKQIYQKKPTNQQKEKQILDFGDTYLLNTFIQTHYKKLLETFQEKTPTLRDCN
ncbi:MAG: hypothetical protein FWD52_09945 [Candidatus Bathyarchaeota archaeon]|nr:hypothetical protein [Candidatus Termiticorpusculum sp.]